MKHFKYIRKILIILEVMIAIAPVSYTHLDVYKRQSIDRICLCAIGQEEWNVE